MPKYPTNNQLTIPNTFPTLVILTTFLSFVTIILPHNEAVVKHFFKRTLVLLFVMGERMFDQRIVKTNKKFAAA